MDFTLPSSMDKRLEALFSCYNLVVANDGPTHLNPDGCQSKLDVMVEPEHDRHLDDPVMIPIGFSDHKLLKARLRCRSPRLTTTYNCRDFKHLNVAEFCSYLTSLPSWTTTISDPDVATRQLDADLLNAVDRYAPLRSHTRRFGQLRSPWLTNDCVIAKRNRRFLERKFAALELTPTDWSTEGPAERLVSFSVKPALPMLGRYSKNSVIIRGNCGGPSSHYFILNISDNGLTAEILSCWLRALVHSSSTKWQLQRKQFASA